MGIPKSAMDAAEKIVEQSGWHPDQTEWLALIIAEPINKTIKKLEVISGALVIGRSAADFDHCYDELCDLIDELKGDDNG